MSDLDRIRVLSNTLVGPELLEKVVESLPDALVVVDATGSVVIFNSQAELLFGYHRSEVLGASLEMLVPDAVRGRHEGHRRSFMSDPRTRPMAVGQILRCRRRDGSELPVQINLSPLVVPAGTFVAAVIRRTATIEPTDER